MKYYMYMTIYLLPLDRKKGFPVAQLVKNPPAIQETPVRFLGWEDPLEKGKATYSPVFLGFPVGLASLKSACNAGSLGWEDSWEKEKATHPSILAWRIPWTV